jgi:hypothetical protein
MLLTEFFMFSALSSCFFLGFIGIGSGIGSGSDITGIGFCFIMRFDYGDNGLMVLGYAGIFLGSIGLG